MNCTSVTISIPIAKITAISIWIILSHFSIAYYLGYPRVNPSEATKSKTLLCKHTCLDIIPRKNDIFQLTSSENGRTYSYIQGHRWMDIFKVLYY